MIKISDKNWLFTNHSLTSLNFHNSVTSWVLPVLYTRILSANFVQRDSECVTLKSKRRKPQEDRNRHHYMKLIFKLYCRNSMSPTIFSQKSLDSLFGLQPITPLPKNTLPSQISFEGRLKTFNLGFFVCFLCSSAGLLSWKCSTVKWSPFDTWL